MRDPSVPIEWGGDVQGSLPVGGAAFYSFKALPGQLFRQPSPRKVRSLLRLYDAQGTVVGSSGDGRRFGGPPHAHGREGGLYRLKFPRSATVAAETSAWR